MTNCKRVVVIPDGFADEPIASLGGRTPMQAAHTPTLDAWAPRAALGRSHNVPQTLSPGSDVATLALLGYDPLECYTGRAPLEAAAQGIELGPDDWAFRCNLTCIRDGIMASFTAGHISTEDATEILADVQREVASQWSTLAPELGGTVEFVPGVSYRNLAIFRPDSPSTPRRLPVLRTTTPISRSRTRSPRAPVRNTCADSWTRARSCSRTVKQTRGASRRGICQRPTAGFGGRASARR